MQGPGQRHLGRRGGVAVGDVGNDRIAQHLAVGQRHVRRHVDALLLQKGGQRAVLQVGAEFDLVGRDLLFSHRRDRLARQGDIEIGDADLCGQALGLRFAQRLHELGHGHAVAGRRPMDQGQVHLLGAQLDQAVLEAGDQLVGRVVGGPDLGGDKQVAAVDARLGNRLAHLRLVAVDLRGIDGAVTDVERIAHRVDRDLLLQAEGADAEGWNSGWLAHG